MASHNTGRPHYSDRDRARNRQPLPPLRDFLGDELTLPLPWQHLEDARIGLNYRAARDTGRERDMQSRARAFTLPSRSADAPAHAPRPTSSRSLPSSYRRNTSPAHAPPPTPTTPPPAYAYHVLRESRSGGLITTVPAVRHSRSRSTLPPAAPQHTQTAGASTSTAARAESEDTRRHVCPVCHKRFNRPSSVRTHQSVHTGSRPFSCPHPGCNKVFSVVSNMRRHLRSYDHEGGGAGDADSEELDDEEEHDAQYEWAGRYHAP